MPQVRIEVTEPWLPARMDPEDTRQTDKQLFTVHFMFAVPGIMVDAMRAGFDENPDHDTVVPRLYGSSLYVRPGVTPDLEFVARPNYTPERWRLRNHFRRSAMEPIVRTMELIRAEHFGGQFSLPQVDFDLDFVMGGGFALNPHQSMTAEWP